MYLGSRKPCLLVLKSISICYHCFVAFLFFSDTDGVIPVILQEREMTVISQDECKQEWEMTDTDTYLFDGHICVFDGADNTTGGSACSVRIGLLVLLT